MSCLLAPSSELPTHLYSDPVARNFLDWRLMDTIDRIERTLDTLRPYIASHKGHVEVVDFDEQDGTLLLRLGGTCHGCAASSITLKQGIESRLREMVPEVKQVQAV